LNDTINTFELFSSGDNILTNKILFKPNSFLKSGLFEHPYVVWSKTRVKFKEILPDTTEQSKSTDFIADKYKLAVKIYLDLNSHEDSVYIGTSTIFDPFDSFYYLPIDNKTQCFINIYFDLCEIKRLELEEKLSAAKRDSDLVFEIYNEFIKEFNEENKKYLEAVQRGTNEKEMRRYNDYVYNKLGINNISLFQAFNNQQ
jgi:hypothetical protein